MCLEIDSKKCHDPISVADHFNCYVVHMASTLVSKLPKPSDVFNVVNEKFVFLP